VHASSTGVLINGAGAWAEPGGQGGNLGGWGILYAALSRRLPEELIGFLARQWPCSVVRLNALQ